MQLDWHDLKTNGCPALLRALKLIETILTQQDAQLSQAETDIAELQYLLSEELIARLAPRSPRLLPRQRQIVAELGGGWRIERQAVSPNASAATSAPLEVSGNRLFAGWCPDSETKYAWHFIDSDGAEVCTCRPTHFTPPAPYPADDGELSGADQLTDVGLTYRELAQRLAEAPNPGSTASTGVSWLPDDWVTQYAAAVDGD
jgi:hypothetical protein